MRAIFLALLTLAVPDAGAQGFPRLTFEQSFARPLPDSFQVSGAAIAGGGVIALWSSNQPYVLLDRDGRVDVIRHVELARPIGAAFVHGDSVLEVVDSRGVVVRGGSGAVTVHHASHDPSTAFDAAVRLDRGWVMGGGGPSGDYRLVLLSERGTPRRLAVLPSPPSGRSPVDLLAIDEAVLVSYRRAPFDVVRVGFDGRTTVWPEPERASTTLDSLASVATEPPLWVGLQLVPLDRGFVRVFADLRSDLRVLTLYSDEGDVVRTSVMSAPLGPLASAPGDGVLLFLRAFGGSEVAGYRWRWGNHQNTGVEP